MTDPFNLTRFVKAQERTYKAALRELRGGRKHGHWMWFIFPQFEGLGASANSRWYAIRSLGEAMAYLDHPVLGPRLHECAETFMLIPGPSAEDILGSLDAMKLKSSMTLFEIVAPPNSAFARVLDEYFRGERDEMTVRAVKRAAGTSGRSS